MPNYVTNIIQIESKNNNNGEVVGFLKQHIKNGIFDFNTFIPEPVSEEECDPEYNFNINPGRFSCNRDVLENEVDRKWFNWLDFRREKWGTKWNTDEPQFFDYNELLNADLTCRPVSIVFVTAWNHPQGIVLKCFEMHPELSIKWTYISSENSEAGIYWNIRGLSHTHYKLGFQHDWEYDSCNMEWINTDW